MPLTPGLARTEMVDEKRLVTQAWQIHFRDQAQALENAPSKEVIVQPKNPVTGTIDPISGAIAIALLMTNPTTAGMYRVTGAMRVGVVASVSSSMSLSVAWTDAGVPCTAVLVPPVTGNTVGSTGSGTRMIRCDAGAPISYSTTYASDAASQMKYFFQIVLESLGGQ